MSSFQNLALRLTWIRKNTPCTRWMIYMICEKGKLLSASADKSNLWKKTTHNLVYWVNKFTYSNSRLQISKYFSLRFFGILDFLSWENSDNIADHCLKAINSLRLDSVYKNTFLMLQKSQYEFLGRTLFTSWTSGIFSPNNWY